MNLLFLLVLEIHCDAAGCQTAHSFLQNLSLPGCTAADTIWIAGLKKKGVKQKHNKHKYALD